MAAPQQKHPPLTFLRTTTYRDPVSEEKVIAHFYYSERALAALAERAVRLKTKRAQSGPMKVKVYVA